MLSHTISSNVDDEFAMFMTIVAVIKNFLNIGDGTSE